MLKCLEAFLVLTLLFFYSFIVVLSVGIHVGRRGVNVMQVQRVNWTPGVSTRKESLREMINDKGQLVLTIAR